MYCCRACQSAGKKRSLGRTILGRPPCGLSHWLMEEGAVDDNFADVKSIFGRAVELAAAERAAFLDHACGGDQTLRAEVESLLAAQPGAGELLRGLSPFGNATMEAPSADAPGAVI